jgi:small conductance mechanosensitive channel
MTPLFGQIAGLEEAQLVHGATMLLASVVILALGWLTASLSARALTRVMSRLHVDATLISFSANLCRTTIIVIVVIVALGQLGVQTASLVAVLGASGLAIALAFQSSLSNLASGFMILFFRLFRAGDRVEIAGASGRVSEILLFHTILAGEDGQRIVIPNATVTGGVIRHWPAGQQSTNGQAESHS